MIDFLKKAIEQAKAEEFVSKTNFLQLTRMIGYIRNKQTAELIQLKNEIMLSNAPGTVTTDTTVQERDASKLTKHIDNDQANIDVADFDVTASKDFATYKATILALLDKLKKDIDEANVAGQKGQVEGN